MAHEIDWSRLARAIEFYKSKGFVYIEVPWVVEAAASRITAPRDLSVLAAWPRRAPLYLVGSAEQSFLQMRMNGLPSGMYVALTPCFRTEPWLDELHQEYFMKVELFRDDVFNIPALDIMTEAAEEFFESELRLLSSSFRQNVDWRIMGLDQHDLEIGGIEIGSYGTRHIAGLKWIYGTGLAEPRFSAAVKRYSNG